MDFIKLIKAFGLTKLNNAEHSEFHASVLRYLQATSSGSFNCVDADLEEYSIAQKEEESLLGRQTANVLTADVDKTDVKRGKLLAYMFSQIDSAAKSPFDEQQKAGQQLQTQFKLFRGVRRRPLAQENTEVRSLIAKMESSEVKEIVKLIPGLSETVKMIEEANNEVAELMSQRTSSEQMKAEALKHRAITDNVYRCIEQRINGTLVLHTNPQAEQIRTEINNLIDRTNNVYNTRMGVLEAKEEDGYNYEEFYDDWDEDEQSNEE